MARFIHQTKGGFDMSSLKLTIDLLPKGAWGNNLSKTLPKKDWDTIRHNVYKKAGYKCEICGYVTTDLDAHEVWDFNLKTKTQTLKDIVALCSRCHGVKHFRNSDRLGYGGSAKRHFLKVNNCSGMAFAKHYAETQLLFEERNKVLRWKIIADLSEFGGKDIEFKQKQIPLIISPYENIDWETVEHVKTDKTDISLKHVLGENYVSISLKDRKNDAKYFYSQPKKYGDVPKLISIDTDNYQGIITIACNDTNKIEWVADGKVIKVKYNVSGKFITKFCIENLNDSTLIFKLVGNNGVLISQIFAIEKVKDE